MMHAQMVLLVLLVFLVLIFAFNHWRERRLIREMENFLSASHQDILIQQKSDKKPLSTKNEPANFVTKKMPEQSVLDTELAILESEMQARLQARKKN